MSSTSSTSTSSSSSPSSSEISNISIINDIDLRQQDENGNYIQPKELTVTFLQEHLQKLQASFVTAGKRVKDLVIRRTELYTTLDAYIQKLAVLQVEEQETGIDDIDEDDPLRFIESDYEFFHAAENCALEDISNVEEPKECIAAMENFVKVLHDNLHRFKHLPKGPLYQRIQLKSKRWAPLAEYVLRPYVFSFLVDNIVDGLVMDELIEEHFPSQKQGSVSRSGVVCPKYHLFAFNSQTQIESRITSISGMDMENMLESIHFDDEDWGKFLSETISVEKIVFMDNENAAFLVMSHIRNTPWHCKMAYTLDGFCVFPFPGFRTKKIRFHPRPMYLKCVPNYEVMELNSTVRIIEKRIQALNKDIEENRNSQLSLAMQIDMIEPIYVKVKQEERQKRRCLRKRMKK